MDKNKRKRINDLIESIPVSQVSGRKIRNDAIMLSINLKKEYSAKINLKGECYEVIKTNTIEQASLSIRTIIGFYATNYFGSTPGFKHAVVLMYPCFGGEIPVNAIDNVTVLENGKKYIFE